MSRPTRLQKGPGGGLWLRRRDVLWGIPLSLLLARLAEAGPRYYLRLRPIEMAPSAIVSADSTGAAAAPTGPADSAVPDGGASPGGTAGPRSLGDSIIEMARENLVAELKKRPEVVLELDGVPNDAPPARIKEELQKRGLRGYEVTLRLLKVERSLRPAPAGRRFRLLEQSVKLSLVGTLYPGDPQLALGGDGESAVQIEVGAQISQNQERDALVEAIKDAVGQAVAQGLRKLSSGSAKPPKDPPRRRPATKPAAK